jgi:hypothetical protein
MGRGEWNVYLLYPARLLGLGQHGTADIALPFLSSFLLSSMYFKMASRTAEEHSMIAAQADPYALREIME